MLRKPPFFTRPLWPALIPSWLRCSKAAISGKRDVRRGSRCDCTAHICSLVEYAMNFARRPGSQDDRWALDSPESGICQSRLRSRVTEA